MQRKQKIQIGFIFLLFLSLGFSLSSELEKPTIALPISILDAKIDLCEKNSVYAKSCASTMEFLEQNSAITTEKKLSIQQRYANWKSTFSGASGEVITDALNTWVSNLDPHAKIVLTNSEESQSNDQYIHVKGLGIKVRIFKDRAFVAYALEGSSAEEIGLTPGDEILAINGQLLQKVSRIKKEFLLKNAKSPFNLLVQRGNNIFQSVAVEKKFKLENISHKIDKGGPIALGVIRIRSFAKNSTCEQIKLAVKDLEEKGATRIELDLRDNPGGYVQEAQCAVGLFLGAGHLFAHLKQVTVPGMDSVPGTPVGTLSGKSSVTLFTDQAKITDIPIQIRINQNTASSAEMFTAAMQDEGRAEVIGTRSFGKGSMQSAYHPWDDPDLLLFKTTHLIDRPNGKSLQYSGVTPDILTEKAEGSNFPREIDLTH